MKIRIIAIISLLWASLCISQPITNRTIRIYWDGSIPGAHAYGWDYPNGEIQQFDQNAYHDLGELSIGVHEFVITNVPGGGGELIVSDLQTLLDFRTLSGPYGKAFLQVWIYDEWAGINFYADAWQYDTWEPDPFMGDYVNGVIPDGLGAWKDGDPYVYAQSLVPVQKKRGKGHNK